MPSTPPAPLRPSGFVLPSSKNVCANNIEAEREKERERRNRKSKYDIIDEFIRQRCRDPPSNYAERRRRFIRAEQALPSLGRISRFIFGQPLLTAGDLASQLAAISRTSKPPISERLRQLEHSKDENVSLQPISGLRLSLRVHSPHPRPLISLSDKLDYARPAHILYPWLPPHVLSIYTELDHHIRTYPSK